MRVSRPITPFPEPRTIAALEIERQWSATPFTHLPARLGAWRAVDGHESVLVDTYFDTADRRLEWSRARLRVRATGTETLATLKRRVGRSGDLRRKVEIEGPCGDDPEQSVPFLAARLLTLDPLHELGVISTRRTTTVYRRDDRRVEVAHDEVDYPRGGPEWRLEAEGHADDVSELARLLEQRVDGLAAVRRGKVQTLLHRLAA
jgi:adenylate cyclase class IV